MAYFQRFIPFLPSSLMSMFSTAASFAASAMLVRTIVDTILPRHLQHYFFSALPSIFDRFSPKLTIVINKFTGLSISALYAAAEVYLTSIVSRSPDSHLRVSKLNQDEDLSVSMDRGETVVDTFQGVKLEWMFICDESKENNGHRYDGYGRDINASSCQESHSFHLTFDKKHRDHVLQSSISTSTTWK